MAFLYYSLSNERIRGGSGNSSGGGSSGSSIVTSILVSSTRGSRLRLHSRPGSVSVSLTTLGRLAGQVLRQAVSL